MTGRAVIRKEDLEAGSLWNWEMQPSVTLKGQISEENERWIRCYWKLKCFFKKRVVSFLRTSGLTEEDRGSGEKEGKRRRREENGATREERRGRQEGEKLSMRKDYVSHQEPSAFLLCLGPCTSELHTLPS